MVSTRRRTAKLAAAAVVTIFTTGLIIGASAGTSSAATENNHKGKAQVAKLTHPRAAARAAAHKVQAAPVTTDATVNAASAPATKPLTVTPHTGLTNNQSVQVSAPSGTFPANETLVTLECNPDSSIPQDGSGCTALNFNHSSNASGGTGPFAFTVKAGKIGSNAKAFCPPTAAQKSAGFTHCVLTVSEPSPDGIHAAQDIVFASETTTTKPPSSGGSSSGSTSNSTTQVKGVHVSKSSTSSSTAGTTAGLPSTGAPYELELLLAVSCLVVGVVLMRLAPTVKPVRSGTASTTTSSPSLTSPANNWRASGSPIELSTSLRNGRAP